MALREAEFQRARDAGDLRYDGCFFAAVVTTGVYCRVVCPAPAPKLENVRLFASAAAAQAAGFRPCRRCHPERAADAPAWSEYPPVLSRALRLIAEGVLDGNDVETLAARLRIGSRHLRRLFVEHLGAPPLAIAKARRVHFARRLLDETDLPVADIAFASGFGSVRQFNHDLRRTFGRPPRELRRARAVATREDGLTLRLPYRPPLDWPKMIAFLQPRAIPGIEVAEHDRYRRTIEIDGEPAVLELRIVREAPYLTLRVRAPRTMQLPALVERARRVFDLNADPVAIGEQLGADALLGPMLRTRPGLRVPGAWDPFEVAVRAVLGQQISVRAATTLAGRLVQAHGTPAEQLAEPGLTRLFPRPEVLAEADLGAIGMTGQQARAITALADAVAAGKLTFDLASGLDEFVARLCDLPGIGPWTAQYVAMRLGEPDAFPAGDLGLRRAAGVTQAALASKADAWRPWRAYAAMYLWTSNGGGSRPERESRR